VADPGMERERNSFLSKAWCNWQRQSPISLEFYCLILWRDGMKKVFLMALFLTVSAFSVASTPGLPFIQDNYAKALAQAKQGNLPIFVEVWAPW
jgi:hypothetical protein